MITPERAAAAQALARHVKAALLHLRVAEDLALRAGIDVDASRHDAPEAGLIRDAGQAVENLDTWTTGYAQASGAYRRETYRDTGSWCHARGGSLPDGSWPAARDRTAVLRGLNWAGDGLTSDDELARRRRMRRRS
jgi:hypothetical protein